MFEPFWKCPACRLEVENREEKRAHLIRMSKEYWHKITVIEKREDLTMDHFKN